MTKPTALLVLGLLLYGSGFAQISIPPKASAAAIKMTSVSGTIADTSDQKNLFNSAVLLLRKSDSVLMRHTRSDKAGHFLLNNVQAGQYILLCTYPRYADYVDELEIKDSLPVQLPAISMVLKSKLLEAVVVSSNKGAIHIKGDTTEFNADSFHTQAGATVEDLLRKLPGIQIDKNGKITAEGEVVKKVLVDGEEFFGDDPTLVTQNFRADMIDKVQVYDKKSDQANFTGIDDGKKDKTINLKLKDGKKNGYFGRLTIGQGTDGYYDRQLMANYFKNKMKLAAYGIWSNTGKTGLGWNERDNYGQSFADNLDVDEATGGLSFTGVGGDELDDWGGQYQGQGFPTVKTGGLHYNNKWDGDRQNGNFNYKYMDLGVNGTSTTNSQFIVPDSFFYNNQKQTFRNQILRHSFNGSYESKFDSSFSVKMQADGGTDHKIINESFHSDALGSDSTLTNQNDRSVTSVGDVHTVNSNILFRKKLAKQGRTLSLNLRENYKENNSSGYLKSNTQLYSDGVPSSDSLIDQFKTFHTQNLLLDARLTYTEPLSKVSYLIFDGGASVDNSNSDRNSFNKQGSGKYTSLDSLYSNNYRFNVVTEIGGLSYRYVTKKFRATVGSDAARTTYDQRDLIADTATRRHFVNWYPRASLGYSITNQGHLDFDYNGQTTQPTVAQLQPILMNENPLNIVIGNPGLKPQFDNRFEIGYNDYKVFSERGIWFRMSYKTTQNAIGTSVNIDSSGKQVTQSVNVNGNYSADASLQYNRKLKFIDMRVGFNSDLNQSKNVSMVNHLLNATTSGSYSAGLSFGKSKEKKYEFYIRPYATYTTSQSTINTGITTHYWTYSLSGQGDLYFPWHIQVHADADISLRQKTPIFTTNNNVVLLNAWIGKKLLKNDALLVKAAGNDLLDQNTGFNRNVSSNLISQNTYSTIKRFFMFSLVWNFSKSGSVAPAGPSMIIN